VADDLKRVPQDAYGRRGDAVEAWLTARRDASRGAHASALNAALEDYRKHADLGIPMTGPWPDDGVYTDPLEAADEAAFTAAMLDEADAPGGPNG
jgi:hypothetical protein